ncbi:MAG: MazG family protein [Clostridia bacterium]|nr:MazG family protein [Clostridia bacterium]
MLKNKKVEYILSREKYDFYDLCAIMEILRGEGGCPWDTEQTHESIRKNFIEETYEVIEAIDSKNTELLREELGDVMLQVVFHTQMERELGNFDINDVAHDVCAKLVHRHPHIFGDVNAETSDEVLKNWEAIKNIEKSRETVYDKLNSVPAMTPALMRASKVAKKSGEYKAHTNAQMIELIKASLDKMSESPDNIVAEDIGEALFLLSALSSKTEIDAEEALFKKTNSFIEKYKN